MKLLDVLFILLIIFLSLLLILFVLLKLAFSMRSDNNPRLKYFTHNDFASIIGKPISFLSLQKTTLNGFIYSPKKVLHKKLVLFIHGIGAGHQAYMHLIKGFVDDGYRVMAFDMTGCSLSEGKSIRGLTQGISDMEQALNFISCQPGLKELGIYVVGHSWGAYVASNAKRFSSKVEKIIVISGFNDTAGIVTSSLRLLKPIKFMVTLANALVFGRDAFFNVKDALKKTKIPMLVVFGKKDRVVKYEKNVALYIKETKENKLVQFYVDENKYHNPYLSVDGEKYLNDIFQSMKKFDIKKPTFESKEFFSNINYELITQNDPVVINTMLEFLKK